MEESIFQSTHFWEAMAFVAIVIVGIVKGAPRIVGSILDSQIDKIRVSIEESETLRSEANETVAKYRRKQQEVEREAQKMLETAKSNIEHYREKAKEKLTNSMESRKREIALRITFAQKRTEQEIHELTTEVVVSSARQAMLNGLSAGDNENLVIKGINEIAPAIKTIHSA